MHIHSFSQYLKFTLWPSYRLKSITGIVKGENLKEWKVKFWHSFEKNVKKDHHVFAEKFFSFTYSTLL
jgi:hypothetical protein